MYTHAHQAQRLADVCCVVSWVPFFIILNDFIEAVCCVKGNHNKCWGFSITALPGGSAVNNEKALCHVDLVFDSAAILLTFR